MIHKTLRNGTKIPMMGLGTYKIENDKVEEIVTRALELGYRHIDTATVYGNEEGIGEALKKTDIPREELFITSKLWNDDQGYESAKLAFEASLERLGLDYLDLYLIHWPNEKSKESWKAIEELYEEGRIKAIGVSNFHEHHLSTLLEDVKIVPMINQYERQPYMQQDELYKVCIKHEIAPEAWAPIAKAKILDDPVLKEIAKKHDKTTAQVVLRWHLQTDYIIFPKTETLDRLEENFNIFDFELDNDDIEKITNLDEQEAGRVGTSPENYTI